jgi:hypothetical protein
MGSVHIISGEFVHDRLHRGCEESYGGSWGMGKHYEGKDGCRELWDLCLEMRKDELATPYHRERADGFSLRGVRKENIRIFFPKRAKEFLMRVEEWDFDRFQETWDSTPEGVLTEELVKKNIRYHELYALTTNLKYKIAGRSREIDRLIHSPIEDQQTLSKKPEDELAEKVREWLEWRKQMRALEIEHDALAKEFRGGE